MSDYITRQEFEEAINALRCYGDQQTINVTQTPGGQTISSTQVLTPTEEDAQYVGVSYDSVAQEFTVNISSLPVNQTDDILASVANPDLGAPADYTLTEVFTFDKPGTNRTVDFFIHERRDNATPSPKIYWNGSSITASDTATQALYDDGGIGYSIANITFNSDGTWLINSSYSYKSPVISRSICVRPILYINTSTREVVLHQAYDCLNNQLNNYTYTYTEPVDDQIILAWNDGDIVQTLDLDTGSSYDEEIPIGKVKITAGNVVERCDLYQMGQAFVCDMGYTGTFPDNNGQTITVRNGRIINKA